MSVHEQVSQAREAAHSLAVAPPATRNACIRRMAELVETSSAEIDAANERDAAQARQTGLAEPLYRRLLLPAKKQAQIRASLHSVADLPDPIGQVEVLRSLDEGLMLRRVRVPIGVIGVIFESRPDALVQIASLCLKSGNAVILKGGSEARHSNELLHSLFVQAVSDIDPSLAAALQLVHTREDIKAILELDHDIDLIIPRGSNELVRSIQSSTRIPVLGHADGICHLYIHADADPAMAIALAVDSKTQYPAVCNATETLLVDATMTSLLPDLQRALSGVELRGCERTRAHIDVAAASDEDWSTEYNDMILAVKIVQSVDEAIAHINRYGSHHTDAICASSHDVAQRFMQEVDSSSVFWNASTRFADGFVFGLGAEVGISTGKIHARGPVGLEGLTTTQYRVEGQGHVIADYAEGRAQYQHADHDPRSGEGEDTVRR